jgi:hypothetical protein
MIRFITKATTRTLCCFAAGALWAILSPQAAWAAQSPGTIGAVTATRQETQDPSSADTGIEWTTGWSYGARGALTLLRAESLEPGFGFSGFAVLPLTADLEIEGEIGYQTMSTKSNGLPAGRLAMFPIRATLRVQLWRFAGAKPYAGGGAGIYLNRFSLDQSVLDDLAQVGFAASANVNPGIGLHAAGGLEWQRDRFHFGVDVKYVFGQADAVSTVVDQLTSQVFRETSKLDLDGFWIAAGARFSF